MNKRAFTLVELLAVIVVLAIILVLAIPRVMNAIEESRKESVRITGENLINGAQDKAVSESITSAEDKIYTITNGAFVGDSFSISGELPDNGMIVVQQDGATAIAASKGDYCIIKYFDEENVSVSKDPDCVLYIPEVVLDTCFTYTTTATEATITDYNNTCSKNVIIPDTLGGLPVKVLGPDAFAYNGLKSVNLPNFLVTMNNWAFHGNLLKKIDFPSTIERIETLVFWSNQLEKVILPIGLKSIGQGAFVENNIVEIDIPNTVTSIGSYAFNKNKMPDEEAFIYSRNPDGSQNPTSLVSYAGEKNENIVMPNNIERIETLAFYHNRITSIIFSANLKYIGSYAFRANGLTNVNLPSGLLRVDSQAFWQNQITSINIPNTVTTIDGGAFNDNLLPDDQAFIFKRNPDGSQDYSTLVSYGGAKKASVVIPSSVETLGYNAMGYNRLTSVTLPSNLKILDNYSLWNNNITSLSFPDGLLEIRHRSLYDNDLTSITIPSSVTLIVTEAFIYNAITNITIPSNVSITSGSISPTFYESYVTVNARVAGTYTAPSQTGVWTKQP